MILSIIIPYYNSEKNINNVLSSIDINKNIEYIFINDGGTDSTTRIIEQYFYSNDNYKIIEKENGGVSSARNVGIESAKGEYILFLDSDDFLYKGAISYLIKLITDCDQDVYSFDYKKTNTVECDRNLVTSCNEIIITRDNFYDDYVRGKLIDRVSVCSCLFKRSFILKNHIRFDTKLSYGEDQIFMIDVINKSKSITYHKGTIILGYFNNISSAMNTFNFGRLLFVNALEEVLNKLDIDKRTIDYRVNKELVGIGTIYYSSYDFMKSYKFYNQIL
ncbi:glycosyltransferase family A protein, partial [Photobacterium sp. GB-36]|uniref:glycosyltransferase family 2 protein n=1 Tax=Photobacterium sp. GB-36 TaxID=2022108 RepID=UPI000D4471A8